jgi:hypothetical protein
MAIRDDARLESLGIKERRDAGAELAEHLGAVRLGVVGLIRSR